MADVDRLAEVLFVAWCADPETDPARLLAERAFAAADAFAKVRDERRSPTPAEVAAAYLRRAPDARGSAARVGDSRSPAVAAAQAALIDAALSKPGATSALLSEVGLSGRAVAPLNRMGLKTLRHVAERSRAEIESVRGVSTESLEKLDDLLAGENLFWGYYEPEPIESGDWMAEVDDAQVDTSEATEWEIEETPEDFESAI